MSQKRGGDLDEIAAMNTVSNADTRDSSRSVCRVLTLDQLDLTSLRLTMGKDLI
jgi:hypothetical protein